LLAANGGGPSVSLFWIDSNNATNITYIAYADVDGMLPTTIAATSAWGNVACVVTSLGNVTLSCYGFNQSGIWNLPSWTRDLGIIGTGEFPTSEAAFSPDNSLLVIQFKSISTGALIFPIQNNALAANPVTIPAQAPLGPASYGFIFLRDNTVVTTDASLGVILYTINPDGSVSASNSSTINPPNTAAYCWMVYSPLTRHAYAISANGNVTEIAIASNNNLTLGATPELAPPLTDGTIISSPGTDWLFILGSSGITVWKITGAGVLNYENTVMYPSGLSSSTMGGIASTVLTTSGASLVQGSILLLALAILSSLVHL